MAASAILNRYQLNNLPYGGFTQMNADDLVLRAQNAQLRTQTEQSRQMFPMQMQKQKLLQSMLGRLDFDGGGSISGRTDRSGIPAPNYLNAGPVWTQGQIDNEAGVQRGNLLQQAATSSQAFGNQMAQRGFSPMSALGGIVNQQNMGRAFAAAAENATHLNFNAAKANSDARLQAGGINAGMYGNYVDAKAKDRATVFDADFRQKQLSQTILQMILGQLA